MGKGWHTVPDSAAGCIHALFVGVEIADILRIGRRSPRDGGECGIRVLSGLFQAEVLVLDPVSPGSQVSITRCK